MKINFCLVFAAMLASGLLAQQTTNPVPAAPVSAPGTPPAGTNAVAPALPPAATATNAPAPQAEKKASAKKKSGKSAKKAPAKKAEPAADLSTVPLVAGPAVVIASNVNVRGQARIKSEIVTRLTKGQPVTVLEEVTLKKSAPDEPSAWAKIVLPPETHVWVSTAYVDATNKTVKPRRLNVRSGPGENYSVLGVLQRGETVKDLSTKGEWMEIEAPTNAYAFMAAQYLRQGGPEVPTTLPPVAAATPTTPAEPTPTPTTVADQPTVAPAPTETSVTPTPTPTEPPAATNAVPTTPPEPEPVVEEPPPKRIVQREGVVRGTTSIQAPTHFELVSPVTGRTINYLYTTSPSLDLQRYKGLHIIVTGEEGLDDRWLNTPLITIQKIQVLE